MTPVRVVPAVDELEDRERGFAVALEPMRNEQLALENGVEALAHRIVVAVANRAHRWTNAGFLATAPERDRRVLTALVRVMDDVFGLTLMDRHVQRVENELRAQVARHRPAHDSPAEYVEHDGYEEEAGQRRNVRVGVELRRSIRVSASLFPQPALRTGRARFHASGSP